MAPRPPISTRTDPTRPLPYALPICRRAAATGARGHRVRLRGLSLTIGLCLFSPSGVVVPASTLRRAERRLGALGFEVSRDEAVLAREQRFAGDDATRLDRKSTRLNSSH